MRVLITGGLGFLGRTLTQKLLDRNYLLIDGVKQPIEEIVLFDATDLVGELPERVRFVKGDIRDAAALADAMAGNPDSIFHLASMVSSEAEERWHAAVDANIAGLLDLVKACGDLPQPPRIVFASSVAAVRAAERRGETPDQQSTYGMTKEVGELILEDASRLGLVDARVARLPTVIIRAGSANRAASGYASGLFRELSQGRPIALPVPAAHRILVIGVNTVVDALIAFHDLKQSDLGGVCILNLPGLSVSVEDLIDAAAEAYGPNVRELVSFEIDPVVVHMMNKWIVDWSNDRAIALGLPHDVGLAPIVSEFNASRR
jgi:D-erythronate 2-dehydrogenase